MNQRRGGNPLGAGTDVFPKPDKVVEIVCQIRFAAFLGRSPDNHPAGETVPVFQQDVFQADSLGFGADLARDADVIHRGHVYQVPAGKGHVTCD